MFGPIKIDEYTYRQRMDHEVEEIKSESTTTFIRAQRLRWLGNVERMVENRTVRITTY